MEARVQIMPVDKPTATGRVYPRHVVEKALQNLKGRCLVVTHVNAFLRNNGCPTLLDCVGTAKDLTLDEATSHVVAHVNIIKVPDDLVGGYVIRSAGVGEVDEHGVVSNFEFTGVIIAHE